MKMAGVERVTISLPDDLLRDIDRREKNRSKFVAEAVRREMIAAGAPNFGVPWKTLIRKAPNWLGRDSKNGRGGCRKKMRKHFLTAVPARPFAGRQAKAGWRIRSEARPVVELDPTIGHEQRAPITGTPGKGLLYPPLTPGKSGLAKKSFALIDHLHQ
jgi:hypothetical protein